MTRINSPLSQHRREIRLVRFLSPSISESQDPPGTIHLELRHASLNDENTRYWALSYVWGDITDPIIIYVNNTPILIRRNLYAALIQLYKDTTAAAAGHAPPWLWIDAICVQQLSVEEKTWQVRLMQYIFSQAEAVQMWLGPGTERSDMAMDFICRFGPRAMSTGILNVVADPQKNAWIQSWANFQRGAKREYAGARIIEENKGFRKLVDIVSELANDVDFRDDLHDAVSLHPGPSQSLPIALAISDLMTREYWNRIWIVQEVALASKARVLCGTKSVPLNIFDSALSVVNISPHGFTGGLSGVFYTCIPLQIRRRLIYNKIKPALPDILIHYTAPPSRPFYSASNPRDIIFGILGLISEEDRLGLVVDYHKTVARVFTEVTKALLGYAPKIGPSNFSLEWCCPRSKPLSYEKVHLPSWVCDWSALGRYGFRVWPVSYDHDYEAALKHSTGVYDPSEPCDNYPEILRRSGCRVSVVTEVAEPPRLYQHNEWSISQLASSEAPNYLSSIHQFVHLGPESGPAEDYIWRTASMGDVHGRHHKWDKMEDATVLEEVMLFLRKIWRGTPVNAAALTPAQIDYIEEGTPIFYTGRESCIQDKIDRLATQLPYLAATGGRGRTLFRTNKLMLGLGHVAVQPGDIVVLLWGEKSPFVIRTRENGGFTFVGDAYIDGIMYGEFLRTEPPQEVFNIY